MKKSGLLSSLKQISAVTEADMPEDSRFTLLQVLGLVLDYINDDQIREAIEEIPF